MTDTPHDPTQDAAILASAYLDDEVTPAERARVDADPALSAEVERVRRVRALLLADTEPPSISAREAHLAAALDVWDQLGAAPVAAGTPTPIGPARARRNRRRSTAGGDRMKLALGVAAGLVVVAGAGAVIRGVIVGTDDDGIDVASSADAAAEEPAEESLGPAEEDIALEFEGGNTGDELRAEIDPSEVASDPDEADLATAAPAAEAAEAPAEEPAEEPAADEEADVADEAASTADDAPPETDLVELVLPVDLADFAAPAAYAPEPISPDAASGGADDEVGFEPAFESCRAERPDGLGIDRLAERAVVVVDGVGELVSVGVDLDDGVAYAFRDDCTVVLEALLPSEEEFLAANPPTTPTTDAP